MNHFKRIILHILWKEGVLQHMVKEFRMVEKCLLYVVLIRAGKGAFVSCYEGLNELVK